MLAAPFGREGRRRVNTTNPGQEGAPGWQSKTSEAHQRPGKGVLYPLIAHCLGISPEPSNRSPWGDTLDDHLLMLHQYIT